MADNAQASAPGAPKRRRRRRRRGKGTGASAVAPTPGAPIALPPAATDGSPPVGAPPAAAALPAAAPAGAPTPTDRRARLRAAILSFLSRHPETQVGAVLDVLRANSPEFDRSDETAALEVLHELVTANLLLPGLDRAHLGWPWLRLTEYGRQVLRQGSPVSFDPDQYLAAAQQRIGELPPLAVEVLRESVSTYHRGFVRSSALLLGTASEIVMTELIDAFIAAQPEKERQKLAAAVEGRSMYARYRLFRDEFDRTREGRRLPDTVSKDIEAIIDLIFNAIRLNRNEAGHPSAAPLNPVLVATTLQAFLEYAERIARLTAYFRETAAKPAATGGAAAKPAAAGAATPAPARRRRTRRGGRGRKRTAAS